MPQEWVVTVLISIPKKGNWHCCNWWGIALLDMKDNMVGSDSGGLQKLESQCGLRR